MKAFDFLNEHGWCQFDLARDNEGKLCNCVINKAVEYCALGVLLVVYKSKYIIPYDKVNELSKNLHGKPLMIYNDDPATKKEDILELFKRAEV